MRTLMFTTAIVSMTAFGAFAQTADQTTTGQAGQTQAAGAQQGQDQMVPAFRASDFMGKNLYTLDTEAARTVRDQRLTQQQDPGVAHDQRQMRWTAGDQFAADRDAWDNVGNIDDIIMTQDGQIRGVIVDVGGFLGFMAHTVMVDMDELYFVHDDRTGTTATGTTGQAEDIDDFSVVATMSREQLEALPEWDDDQLQIGFERRDMGAQRGTQMQEQQQVAGQQTQQQPAQQQATGTQTQQQPTQQQATGTQTQQQPGDQQQATGQQMQQPGQPGAPAQPPEGYAAVDTAPSADALIGADVVDANGNSIGQVEDAVLAQDGAFSYLVVDVGGFLGIGTHRVALEAQDVELFHNQQNDTMRVHVPMTEEQLESLPEYQG